MISLSQKVEKQCGRKINPFTFLSSHFLTIFELYFGNKKKQNKTKQTTTTTTTKTVYLQKDSTKVWRVSLLFDFNLQYPISKSFLALEKGNAGILSTLKRSFSKKLGKTPSSHIIHSLGGEYCWIVRASEPVRLLKSPIITKFVYTYFN